jgi:ectoine hydroxylase-related dioxygenase (phytanoyl-CoA dioxygenase family)
MAEHLYLGKYKGVEDAARVESGSNRLNEEIKTHIERIAVQADGMGLETKQLLARRGDVLFWSADLAHGGRPVSLTQTRKSVVTHYCPTDVVPSYFENRPGAAPMWHKGVASYSTSHYRGAE